MKRAKKLAYALMLQAQILSINPNVSQAYAQGTQKALHGALVEAVGIKPAPAPKRVIRYQHVYEDLHDETKIASRYRALLLEVVRRAAHDYVLWRNSRRPEREFALTAHVWLFEEKPGHPDWELRKREGYPLLAFLNICDCLDLDPDALRARIRKMTVRDIKTAGRPAETRKLKQEGIEDYTAPAALDTYDVESYEEHFALPTY